MGTASRGCSHCGYPVSPDDSMYHEGDHADCNPTLLKRIAELEGEVKTARADEVRRCKRDLAAAMKIAASNDRGVQAVVKYLDARLAELEG